MDKVFKAYKKWRSEHDEDYCYDEIFSFLDVQSRGDMLKFMDEAMKCWEAHCNPKLEV